MLAWLKDPRDGGAARPRRVADVVVGIASEGTTRVVDGLVDLEAGRVIGWEGVEGVQPLVCLGFFSLNCRGLSRVLLDGFGLVGRLIADWLVCGRLRWKICNLLSGSLGRMKGLWSSVLLAEFRGRRCIRFIVIVGVTFSLYLFPLLSGS